MHTNYICLNKSNTCLIMNGKERNVFKVTTLKYERNYSIVNEGEYLGVLEK